MKNFRCYVFVHKYLFPLGKGIQAAHAVAELMLTKHEDVFEWAENHKTIIVLDGGFSSSMQKIKNALIKSDYPFSEFYEDRETLEGLMTALAVVIDVDDTTQRAFDSEIGVWHINTQEESFNAIPRNNVDILEIIRSSRLAS